MLNNMSITCNDRHPSADTNFTLQLDDSPSPFLSDWRIVRGLLQAAETMSSRSPLDGLRSNDIEKLAVRAIKVDTSEIALAISAGYNGDLFPDLHLDSESGGEPASFKICTGGNLARLPDKDSVHNLAFCEDAEILDDGDLSTDLSLNGGRGIHMHPLHCEMNIITKQIQDPLCFQEEPPKRANSFDETALQTEMLLESSPSSEPKRKRRPRRCQNRIVIEGKTIICGLVDCPGRGGQKFCKSFVAEAKQRQGDDSKLSTLATLVRPPAHDNEIAAMEALQNLI